MTDVSVDDGETRHRSRKDTRHWCRGKVGTAHVEAVEHRSTYGTVRPCGWHVWGRRPGKEWRFACYHAVVCSSCGKVLRPVPMDECPDRVPVPTDPPRYQPVEFTRKA